MNLRFAFAVNNNNQFEKKHFGDADKYMIYQQESDEIVLSSEEPNRFKLLDEEIEHGSKRKGKEVIKVLTRHLHWIKDEWEANRSNFKLFTIKSGILKSSIEK